MSVSPDPPPPLNAVELLLQLGRGEEQRVLCGLTIEQAIERLRRDGAPDAAVRAIELIVAERRDRRLFNASRRRR